MRAHTITTTIRPRPSALHRGFVLGLAVCSLVVPATATASPAGDAGYSSVSAITGDATGSSDRSADSGSGYSSLNAITGAPASSSEGQADSRSGYSSLNAITGAPPSEPTFVSGGPGDPVGGFDWGSAAIGAGAVLATGALGAATLLTVRRRTATAPSVSTS